MIDIQFLTQSPGWKWSFSRLQQFHQCKYGWLLKYGFEVPQRRLFFSEFGKLMHELIAGVLSGALTWPAAEAEYVRRFHGVLQCHGPLDGNAVTTVGSGVKAGYFMDGLRYLQNGGGTLAGFSPMEVESYEEFELGGHPFCGYVDLVANNGNAPSGHGGSAALCIIDHKSRALKERGPRRAKSNALLDEHLRQLYLYSIPVRARYYQPDRLCLNCFRGGNLISEPFTRAAFEETAGWALRTIEEILHETDWLPREELWQCRHLCDVAGACEYAGV